MKKLAIDTNVIVKAFKDRQPEHCELVYSVPRYFHLVLDYNQKIQKEYRNNVGLAQGFQKWWKHLQRKKAFAWAEGNLDNKHRCRLSSLGCHEDLDHTVLAVAYNTDKLLVSEDSDFGKGPKGSEPPHCDALAYIRDKMGVCVLDAHEAVELLLQPEPT